MNLILPLKSLQSTNYEKCFQYWYTSIFILITGEIHIWRKRFDWKFNQFIFRIRIPIFLKMKGAINIDLSQYSKSNFSEITGVISSIKASIVQILIYLENSIEKSFIMFLELNFWEPNIPKSAIRFDSSRETKSFSPKLLA